MSGFERWSVWLTSVATTVTGLIYLFMKYVLTSPEPWAAINHPLQPLILKAHIVVSPFLLFAIGLITLRHVWRHYTAGIRWGRRSGMITALFVGPMVLSGYLIQAITHMGWVRAMALAHIGMGLVYAFGLVVHQFMVRRRRQSDFRTEASATAAARVS